MLTQKEDLTKIMFFDLETTSVTEYFSELSEKMQDLFKLRFQAEIDKKLKDQQISTSEIIESVYSDKAPFHPEFGKIVSIAWGFITDAKSETFTFKSRNICSTNESEMLKEFSDKISKIKKIGGKYEYYLCAHNGTSFDFPFLAKRLIINRISLPPMLDYSEFKPWDVEFLIDTRNAWRYGVFDASFSLDLICTVLGVDSPKINLHGSKIKDAFYKDKKYTEIGTYCEQDILALATCYLRMKGIYNPIIKEN